VKDLVYLLNLVSKEIIRKSYVLNTAEEGYNRFKSGAYRLGHRVKDVWCVIETKEKLDAGM